MSAPPPHFRLRKAVRGFYAWLGSLVFAGVAPIVATRLVATGTMAGRIAGVVLGTIAWLPMAWSIAAIIRAADEFERRMHLIALAFSFGSALLLLTLLDWLVRAEFLRRPPLQVILLACAILWVVWLVAVKRHFERHP